MSYTYLTRFEDMNEDMNDYNNLCKKLNLSPRVDFRKHFNEIKSLPYVKFLNFRWIIDYSEYPEYLL